MLKEHEVRKRLGEMIDSDLAEKHQSVLKAIPRIGRWAPAEQHAVESRRRADEGVKSINPSLLSDSQRGDLFRSLFPRLQDVLEHAWQRLPQLPYRVSAWDLRPFRAPTHRAVLDFSRDQWFARIIDALSGYDADAVWLATWCAHLSSDGGTPATLLAASIDMGGSTGDEVFEILKQSAVNRHEIGVMGGHVVHAMLASERTEAWEFIEKLLLAAQRQEGLRQNVLESLDVAHPQAFRRMMRLIRDEGLVRFSSAVRAIDVLFGLAWDSMATKHAQSIVERVVAFLDDDTARAEAIGGKDHESAYLALWCEAHSDASSACAKASELLASKTPERRWLGVQVLDVISLPECVRPIIHSLSDSDLRVASRAFDAVSSGRVWSQYDSDPAGNPGAVSMAGDLFDRLEGLLKRLKGRQETFEPLVFPWGRRSITAEQIGLQLVDSCPPDRAERLFSLLDRFDARSRQAATWIIAGRKPRWHPEEFERRDAPPLSEIARRTLIGLLADPSKDVREAADNLLSHEPATPEEVATRERALDRAASDIRSRGIARLLTQSDEAALASASRLLDGKAASAKAGLEILSGMIEKGRSPEAAIAVAVAARQRRPKPAKDLRAAFDSVMASASRQTASEADAFGLAKGFTPRPIPSTRRFTHSLVTPAAVACIWSLNDLVEANKTLEVRRFDADADEFSSSDEDRLLGTLTYSWTYGPSVYQDPSKDRERCAIIELVQEWMINRPADSRDDDGLELARAWCLLSCVNEGPYPSRKVTWPREVSLHGREGVPAFYEPIKLVLNWAMRLQPGREIGFFLDNLEDAVSRDDLQRFDSDGDEDDSTGPESASKILNARRWLTWLRDCPADWEALHDIEVLRRLDGLLHAADERASKVNAERSAASSGKKRQWRISPFALEIEEFLRLWNAGAVSDAELLIRACRTEPNSYDQRLECKELFTFIGMCKRKDRVVHKSRFQANAAYVALMERLRRRVLEVEFARGDAASPATPHALRLDPSGGIDAVIPALAGLGKTKLVRGYIYGDHSKAASYSKMIRNSHPSEQDTPEAFATAVRAAGISDDRLVELALYQPRWAEHVEHTLKWAGLVEGALWLRSHTKEPRDSYRLEDQQEAWEARAAELTPIPRDRLADGAVDRAWFERSHKRLGPKRWEILYQAAKYASSGIGHTRARLFADAILGKVTEKDLTSRVTAKRHQDAARALGLLSLKSGAAGKKQLMARFNVLQEMRRTSRKHGGSMLQASEKRAVEIGMENLAWTAGYPDPLRLQWSMEIEQFGDLAKGPVSVKVGETTVTLAVDDDGKPELTATKGGKILKAIPPNIKKDKKVAPLAERVSELRRQTSRVRQALEQSMCRGDFFAGEELVTLFGHPLLKSMLGRLIMVGETKAGGSLIGYPDKGGKALRAADGSIEPMRATDRLRLAHPVDLLATGRWHEWQAECFRAERVQPFKQVFRELYTPLETELAKSASNGGGVTRRYAGQQVQPRQALALLGSRGWVARAEEGVQRTFHSERLTVYMEFEEGFYTPAEVDGLTVAGVSFHAAGKFEPVAIKDVPPRLFSEVLRDVDLVVSVAHRGEVDPEASHSTVEMRAALLRETCALLSLGNVRIEGSRAIIRGDLGEYALHLGSGSIHKIPGGTMWVIPVHSQHRGRMFLPFADDDPKTAEVISKALLLSRDRDIQDPMILAQIRGS